MNSRGRKGKKGRRRTPKLANPPSVSHQKEEESATAAFVVQHENSSSSSSNKVGKKEERETHKRKIRDLQN